MGKSKSSWNRKSKVPGYRVVTAKVLSRSSSFLSYLSSRLVRPQGTKEAISSHSPIVIHNMAKVGSKTIMNSLKVYDPRLKVYQTHFLTPAGLNHAEEKMEKLPGRVWDHIDECRKISREIRSSPESRQWKMISLVRDPVARDMSYFFHCLTFLYPEVESDFLTGRVGLQHLIRLFQENLDESSPLHFVQHPLKWFDLELKPLFGIDVFSEPFPKEQGYCIYKSQKAVLLVLRLESLEECVGEAFNEFLGIKDFRLVPFNTAEQKIKIPGTKYYALYEDFKREIHLSPAYLDKMYSSKLVKHFYTEEEIESFRQRWRVLHELE
jgi:hypothetical protein